MPYEDDRYRQAMQWAKAQGVQKGYPPGRVPDRLIDDLMAQYLAAHPLHDSFSTTP